MGRRERGQRELGLGFNIARSILVLATLIRNSAVMGTSDLMGTQLMTRLAFSTFLCGPSMVCFGHQHSESHEQCGHARSIHYGDVMG